MEKRNQRTKTENRKPMEEKKRGEKDSYFIKDVLENAHELYGGHPKSKFTPFITPKL